MRRRSPRTVTPLDSIADELQKVGVGTMDATLTKTAQTKQIAGFPCTVHDINLSLPFSPTGQSGQGMDLTMVLSGTVCLSTAAPGLADYQAFYKAAADSGFIFGDPRIGQVAHRRGAGQGLRRADPQDGRSWHGAGEPHQHLRLGRQPDGGHDGESSPRATSSPRSRRSRPAHCPPNPSRFPRTTR